MDAFVELSAELTGFSAEELRSTGLVEQYRALADGAPENEIIQLWYTGVWRGVIPDERAYAEGLAWKAVGVAAPGTRAPGFGSWEQRPRSSAR
ncbi:hypothetical protein [Lentzea albidocapillata]|uniref:Uncharacterized protein n=1 Tax=Lentzea albidocapillata TaxID=40571 RepID=A0A1W2ACZ0_9PSEU|nr:hypothetical protein [Lentzea albidocapillata]SMC58516.1 hypothetical protein SAMN05660733_00590 [Lentzea albidocapillata]